MSNVTIKRPDLRASYYAKFTPTHVRNKSTKGGDIMAMQIAGDLVMTETMNQPDTRTIRVVPDFDTKYSHV